MGYGNKKIDCVEPARKLAEHMTKLELMEFGLQKWKIRIWENLGWHYSVVSPCGRWKVHPHHHDNDVKKAVTSYTAFLGPESQGGRWAGSARTARAAVMKTATVAYDQIYEDASLLDLPIPPRRYT